MAIPLPDLDQLPNGPLRELVVSLHQLYDHAGQPAARLISKDIFRLPNRLENVSHQTVSAVLHGTTLPAWGKVKSIVVALAQRGELDAEEKDLDRFFKPLWVAARGAGRTVKPAPEASAMARPSEPRPGPRPDLKLPSPMYPEPLNAVLRSLEAARPRTGASPPAPPERIVGGLPDRIASFTGREALLDRVRTEIVAKPRPPMVLHGVSGVGKSQLVREYVERYQPDYLVIWWVQADEMERARRSLLDLAGRLGTRVAETAEQTIERVIQDLEALVDPYLLVFDGVSDDEVRLLTPNFGGHVIVTTCDPAFGHESASGIEVPDFTVEEAVAFLRKRDPALTDDRAMQLVGEVGRLPRALEHAAALRRAP